MIAGRDFDEEREVATRRHRQPDIGLRDAEKLETLTRDSEAVVFRSLHPLFELDDQIDRLHVARRRDAEKVLDVDDADAAQLHVMPEEVVRVAQQHVVRMAFDDDHVVGNQSVAAIDQVERAFTLSDTAVAQQQHADAIDIEQTRMHRDLRRHRLFEEVRRSRDGNRRHRRRREQRNGALLTFELEFVERRDAFGHDEAGDVERGVFLASARAAIADTSSPTRR